MPYIVDVCFLYQCMSPTYMPLVCASGECGPLYNGTSAMCPTPCYLNVQCAHCLQQPGCGWCGMNNGNGTGVCMEGGLHGPLDGVCTAQNVSLQHKTIPSKFFGQRKLLPEHTSCLQNSQHLKLFV